MAFMFDLNGTVVITKPNKRGTIKGRAEYANGSPDSYWVQFVDGQGDLNSGWFDEQDLSWPQD